MMNLKQPLNQSSSNYSICTDTACTRTDVHTTFVHTFVGPVAGRRNKGARKCFECMSVGYHKSYCRKSD